MTKIIRKGPFLCGVSGAVAPSQRFLDWFKTGLKGNPPEMPDGERLTFAVIIMPTDLILTYGPAGWERTRNAQTAVGSGADFAQGAMAHGADAVTAVAIACRFDTKSGPPIVSLTR